MDKQQTPIGFNRTGVQMSPIDTDTMRMATSAVQPTPSTEPSYVDVRQAYAHDAEPLGSVPVPGNVKGMLKTGTDMLTGKRPQVLVDKLGERLAFERGGVRLYESLLVKCGTEGGLLPPSVVGQLQQFRDEEAQHLQLVTEALQALGADPTAQTPCADLAGVESAGLVQAMNDPRSTLQQGLNVILDAELVDNAGWEMLIELANACGHGSIAQTFEIALQQEARHLLRVRELLSQLTLQDAGLGDEAARRLAAMAH
ncbi:MAG: ferritin-like domain-containing protein [Rhizobacter sp.]|nr:ferritin-like domain-containing protein [Rhizobacter sp.]